MTGFAGTPAGDPGAGHSGHPTLDLEAVLLENLGDVALRLELLEPELREAEEAVDDLLGEVASSLDVDGDLVLERLEALVLRQPQGHGDVGTDESSVERDGQGRRQHHRAYG